MGRGSWVRRAFLGGLALALGAGAQAAFGQSQPDETLPGFKLNQIYDVSKIDNINVFSGDPGVVVPLGPAYTLGPATTWQLKAYYSSKPWVYDSNQNCSSPGQPPNPCQFSFVGGQSTLGAGWTLRLGAVERRNSSQGGGPTYYYHAPEGSSVPMCEESQAGCSPLAVPMDGRHWRLRDTGQGYELDFPDGTVHHFGHLFFLPLPAGTAMDFYYLKHPSLPDAAPGFFYGLDSIRDPFGTEVLHVDYVAPGAFSPHFVRLNPGTSTERAITFQWGGTQVLDAANGNPLWPTLSAVLFPTVSGTLTVSFGFQPAVFPRQWPGGPLYPMPVNAAVPLLSSITQATTSGPSSTFRFSYVLDPASFSWLIAAGLLESLTLPTGGTIAYTYGPAATRGACTVPPAARTVSTESVRASKFWPIDWEAFQAFSDESASVIQRKQTDPTTPGLVSTTTYCRRHVVGHNLANELIPYRRVIVTDGDGVRQHLFTTQFTGAPPGAEVKRQYFSGADTNSPIIRTIVSCYGGQASLGGAEVTPICGINRSDTTYFQDYSGIFSGPRLQKTVTWYGDLPFQKDGGDCSEGTTPCWQSAMFNYNFAAAEYETEKKSSNNQDLLFQMDSRTTTTHWTPSVDASHWFLKLFDYKTVSDDFTSVPCPRQPCFVRTDYSFNSQNGFLNNVTTTDPTYGLLRRAFESDGAGNPSLEVLSADSPNGSMTGFFVTHRTFQNGRVLTSQRDLIPWKSFDVTRDGNTGLITFSRDPNGAAVQTRYDYDGLRRLKRVTPPGGEAPMTYCYVDWSAGAPSQGAYVLAKKGSASDCSTDDGVPGVGSGTVEAYQFDGLGRVRRQVRRLPNALSTGSYLSFQESRYDAAGHRTFLSEWSPCGLAYGATDVRSCLASSAATGTTWSNFDFQGRARQIQAADGAVTTKSFDDPNGILSSDFTELVTQTRTYTDASGQIVTGPLTGGSRKDILGHTLFVAEPGPPPFGPVTAYEYNVLDKLALVNLTGQYRYFNYDQMGFLRSETHPEKGTTTYFLYDAMGNALTSTESDGTVINRGYDTAGRLRTVTAGGSLYIDNTYDGACNPATTAAPFPCGKLTRRVGHNPMGSPAIDITEDFSYASLAGRLSDKTTSFSSGSLSSVTEHWFYDTLGEVIQYDHPRAGGAKAFVLSTAYSGALPVTEYANGIPVVTAISYQPSGATKSYTAGINAGHNVTTTIELDLSLMTRPRRISAVEQASGATPFDTGPYSYDAAGNITATGSDSFSYDAQSRLTLANLSGAGSQAFTYDPYGNMLSKGGVTFAVNATTNRVGSPYSYDGRGNVVGTGAFTYGYDTLDRQVSHVDGGSTYSYVYSGESERLIRVLPSPEQPVYTLRDEGKRVAAQFVGSTPSRDNVFLGNLLVVSLANTSVAGSSEAWHFHSSDHLGTARLDVGLAGNVIDTRKYWPYGESISPPLTDQRLRFAGMENDTEAGSRYYDHARSHDGALGRFLSPDPLLGRIADPQSWNRYTYARGNPVRLRDRTGLSPEDDEVDPMEAKHRAATAEPAKTGRLEKIVDKVVDMAKDLFKDEAKDKAEKYGDKKIEEGKSELKRMRDPNSPLPGGGEANKTALETAPTLDPANFPVWLRPLINKLNGPANTANKIGTYFNDAIEGGGDAAQVGAQRAGGEKLSNRNRELKSISDEIDK